MGEGKGTARLLKVSAAGVILIALVPVADKSCGEAEEPAAVEQGVVEETGVERELTLEEAAEEAQRRLDLMVESPDPGADLVIALDDDGAILIDELQTGPMRFRDADGRNLTIHVELGRFLAVEADPPLPLRTP